jgi:hypothetical protein
VGNLFQPDLAAGRSLCSLHRAGLPCRRPPLVACTGQTPWALLSLQQSVSSWYRSGRRTRGRITTCVNHGEVLPTSTRPVRCSVTPLDRASLVGKRLVLDRIVHKGTVFERPRHFST